ncbi:helix-turn-helix transcriptional regulator [Rugosimonospora africana]|nr:LuxR family transcriptional regulator [Rugosimonospora africana]
MQVGADAQWPLGERDADLRRLLTALDSRPRALVIDGPTGSGRTRLVDELSRNAEQRGWQVIRAVTAPWLADLPLVALTALLHDQTAVSTPDDHGSLFRRVRQATVDASGGQPILLVVDDAHFLDDASAALVHFLAATGAITVAATTCADRPVPAPVAALCAVPQGVRADLRPLRRDSVVALLAASLPGPRDPALDERLWQLSQGSPLMLRELLTAAQQTGALRQDGGRWRLDGPLTASRRLRDVVNLRIGQLSAGVREVAEILAVAQPLGVAMLESLTSPEYLSAAEGTGLVVERVDGRRVSAALAHPLYADVLRAELPPARLRAIQRQLADRLDATGARRQDDLLRLVLWRSDVGDHLSPEVLLSAADRAAAGYDHATAGRLAVAAVAVGAGLRGHLAAAAALHNLGRVDEAEQILAGLSVDTEAENTEAENTEAENDEADDDEAADNEVDEAADNEVDDDEAGDRGAADKKAAADSWDQGQLALHRATILLHGYGRPRAAAATIAATIAGTRPSVAGGAHDAGLRDELDALHAQARLLRGEPAGALDEAARLLTHPDTGDRAVLAALLTAVPALAVQGRGRDTIDAAEYACQLATRLGEPSSPALDLIELTASIAYVTTGRLVEHAEQVSERYRQALSTGNEPARGMWALAGGSMALQRGAVVTAAEGLVEATHLLAEHPTLLGPYGLAWCLCDLATAYALAGDPRRAQDALDRADDVLAADIPLTQRLLARPWLEVARGDLARARDLALAAADEIGAAGFRVAQMQALLDAARIDPGDDVADRLGALAPRIDGPLIAAAVRFARAGAVREPGGLADAARAFEDAGMMLVAAEAWARAAEEYRRVGRTGPAALAAGHVTRLVPACEGASTPGLAAARRHAALTRREEQILRLVREGLTNRQIAERLVLSPRTVESHRNNAYRKLDVTSVEELSAVLDA